MSRLSLSAFACGMMLAFGCDEVPTVAPTPVTVGAGIGGGPGTGGAGGVGGAHGPTTGSGGAPMAPVRIGVHANVASAGPPALAELRAFAAGVRLSAVDVPFDAVDEAALSHAIADHLAKQLRVVVTLLVVDGERALRPAGLGAADWDDPAMQAALLDAIAMIEGAGPVEAIVIGRRVDRYLEAFPAEAVALAELLEHGVTSGPAAAPRGIGLMHDAGAPSPIAAHLGAIGEISARSYLPGIGAATYSPVSAAMDLDALTAAAADRPVLLAEVAFPSGSALGASEESQRQALDAFFAALEPRRTRFPWILVHQLHDLDEAACESLAAAQNEEPEGPWASYACHTGLRTHDDEPKAAWGRFLEATARFASP